VITLGVADAFTALSPADDQLLVALPTRLARVIVARTTKGRQTAALAWTSRVKTPAARLPQLRFMAERDVHLGRIGLRAGLPALAPMPYRQQGHKGEPRRLGDGS